MQATIAPTAITLDALVVLLPDSTALAPGRLASTLGRVAPLCESLADSCSSGELKAVPSARRALPALLLLATETAQLSPHVLCIHHNALTILSAVAPGQSNAANPVQFGRLFDVLTDCQTAPYPEAAKSVTLLVRRLAESQGGYELLLGQRGVIALLRMLDSQPNCPQVLTNSCEACRAIITRSVHGHLERLEAEALRTITSKSIHSLDQAPRSAGVNVAWSAACASLVAHFRYDCGSSLRFPKLLGDRQQQSHYLEDAKAASLMPHFMSVLELICRIGGDWGVC